MRLWMWSLRVAGSAGAVAEAGHDEPLAGQVVDAGVAALHAAGLAFEEVDGDPVGGLHRGDHLGGHVVVAEGPHEADRLRDRQREVERDPAHLTGAEAHVCPGLHPFEDRPQVGLVDDTVEAEAIGRGRPTIVRGTRRTRRSSPRGL